MDPILMTGVAKIIDLAFTAWLAGMEREPIVAKVREMEAAGATMKEITDALEAMRVQSESDAQAKIDKAKAEGR